MLNMAIVNTGGKIVDSSPVALS